ncbi:hypothetical protein M409DRAFT_51220 [Zasmidium cellare ATCC 36951]|uniref:Uncharacterized protein n=1 Tax=Zasmidium cellare ATCC 36951 TaxID=1080233 RepID=A0A6A6CV16_ZASCE|nr:uncharacterized protein M409DRAFT_51220 [Zasmidium cellare ATCC 36951]KAF2170984.1 hypothetical protein M409DRAFT_51220 [Zasmidium cellare ATCC 36951]
MHFQLTLQLQLPILLGLTALATAQQSEVDFAGDVPFQCQQDPSCAAAIYPAAQCPRNPRRISAGIWDNVTVVWGSLNGRVISRGCGSFAIRSSLFPHTPKLGIEIKEVVWRGNGRECCFVRLIVRDGKICGFSVYNSKWHCDSFLCSEAFRLFSASPRQTNLTG